MSKVIPVTSALAAAMLAVAPGALAQDSATSPWHTGGQVSFPRNSSDTAAKTFPSRPNSVATSADTTYIRQAMRANLTEVALGRGAEDDAENTSVKEFAKRMVSDHNAANEKWTSLGNKNRMKFELKLSPEGEAAAERLKDLDDAEYDRAYMSEMIRLHEQNLANLQRMEQSALSSEVRQLASTSAAATREHLALAQQVGRGVGVSTIAGRTGGVTNPAPFPSDSARRRTTDTREATDQGVDRDDRGNPRPLRAEDRAFVERMLGDHLMHVRLAKRAQRETKSDDTRRLAERIEKDLGNWADRWESFADRRNANVTSHLEREQRDKVQRLDKASEKKNFDRVYAEIVANHLESLVSRLRAEEREDKAGAVGRLAEKEIPVIRDLLVRARRIENQTSARADNSDRK